MNEKQAMKRAIDARLSGLTVSRQQRADLLLRAQEGEKPVKKKISVSLIVAVALLMLAATACAAAVRFGMLDYKKNQAGNASYMERILSLNETYENDDLSISVNDAAFDGAIFSVTVEVHPKDGGDNLFIYPQVSATCGGLPCEIAFAGSQGADFHVGFFSSGIDGAYGADYEVVGIPAGPITWTVAFSVLRPEYPVELNPMRIPADDDPNPDPDAPTYEDYMESFAQGCRDGVIYLAEPLASMELFEENLPRPKGISAETWEAMEMAERLVASGAFSLVGMPTAVFTTESADVLTCDLPMTIDLDEDYEVTLTSLTVTSAYMDYKLSVRRKEGHGKSAAQEYIDNDGGWTFAVLIPDGETTPCADGLGVNEEDGSVICDGTVELSHAADEVIFVPCWDPSPQSQGAFPSSQVYRAQRPLTDEQERLMFTVKLR